MRRIVPGGVDVVVEVDPQTNAAVAARCLAANGTVATYADDGGGGDVAVPVRASMVPNARWQFVLVYTLPQAAKARAVDDLGAALLDRAIGVGEAHGLPLHHFGIDEAAQAHAAVEQGAVGKVLITLGSSPPGWQDDGRERRGAAVGAVSRAGLVDHAARGAARPVVAPAPGAAPSRAGQTLVGAARRAPLPRSGRRHRHLARPT